MLTNFELYFIFTFKSVCVLFCFYPYCILIEFWYLWFYDLQFLTISMFYHNFSDASVLHVKPLKEYSCEWIHTCVIL